MREIGIDTFGNVETISKLEFDKSAISKYLMNNFERSKKIYFILINKSLI